MRQAHAAPRRYVVGRGKVKTRICNSGQENYVSKKKSQVAIVLEGFPARLRDARVKAGFDEGIKAAKALNTTRQAYGHYERGVRIPRLEMFITICELFNVSPEQLLPVDVLKKPRSGIGNRL